MNPRCKKCGQWIDCCECGTKEEPMTEKTNYEEAQFLLGLCDGSPSLKHSEIYAIQAVARAALAVVDELKKLRKKPRPSWIDGQ